LAGLERKCRRASGGDGAEHAQRRHRRIGRGQIAASGGVPVHQALIKRRIIAIGKDRSGQSPRQTRRGVQSDDARAYGNGIDDRNRLGHIDMAADVRLIHALLIYFLGLFFQNVTSTHAALGKALVFYKRLIDNAAEVVALGLITGVQAGLDNLRHAHRAALILQHLVDNFR